MFVYYFVTLAMAFGTAEERLMGATDAMGELAGAAYREGEEIRARIGIGGERPLIAKTVRLTTGSPLRSESQTTLPVIWEATGPSVLFPRMDGDLVLAPMGPELTQLAFRGSYRPPLGGVGRAIDRTMLHRVAEASVKGFLDRVARAMTTEVDLGPAVPPMEAGRAR